jgi:hypothetical protein
MQYICHNVAFSETGSEFRNRLPVFENLFDLQNRNQTRHVDLSIHTPNTHPA